MLKISFSYAINNPKTTQNIIWNLILIVLGLCWARFMKIFYFFEILSKLNETTIQSEIDFDSTEFSE
jgi:hypothetical protein